MSILRTTRNIGYPESALDLLESGQLKSSHTAGTSLVLNKPAEAAGDYQQYLGSLSNRKATELWGRELVHAKAYHKSKYKHSKRYSTVPAKFDIEFSLRVSGAILSKVHFAFIGPAKNTKSVKDIRKWASGYEFNWKNVAHLDPMSHQAAILMARTWDDLGYMVKIHKGNWVEAELALDMMKRLGNY